MAYFSKLLWLQTLWPQCTVYSALTNVFELIYCNDCQFNELLKDIHVFVVQSVEKIE